MIIAEASFGERQAGVTYLVRPCAYAVVVDGPKVLVVQGSSGGWFLPGGGLEQNEGRERGLLREIREELGCSATVDPAYARATQYLYSQVERTHFELHATYHVATLEDFLTSKGDHASEWVVTNNIEALLKRAADAWAVSQFLLR